MINLPFINYKSITLLSLFLIVFSISTSSNADLNIVTPSSTILQPLQFSARGLFGVDHDSHTAAFVTGSSGFLEFQAAELAQPGHNTSVLSIQGQIFPQTSVSPAISVGVRDIFNSTHSLNAYGFGGRSFYGVIGELVPNADKLPHPFTNLTLTFGEGTGVTNGAFGCISSNLIRNIEDQVEFDGKKLNYRVTLSPGTNIVKLEYDNIHGIDFVGIRFETPSVSLFNPL